MTLSKESNIGKSISDQMAITGGDGNKKLNQKQVKDLKKKKKFKYCLEQE